MEYIRFIFSAVISLIINTIHYKTSRPIKNILLIRLDHIGDMMCTLESLYNIRKTFMNAEIKLVTGRWNKELFLHGDLIDNIIVYNSPVFTRDKKKITSYRERWFIYKNLRKDNFDLIIDFRSDYFMMLISLFLFPKLRRDRGSVRISGKITALWNRVFKSNMISPVHETETNREIISPFLDQYKETNEFFRFSEEEKIWFQEYLRERNLNDGHYAVLHPGASWIYKQWDHKNFREVGEYLLNNYGLYSFIIGTQDENEIGVKILSDSNKKFFNIIGKTSLRQTILLIKNATIVICNDSSPMQIASRMDVPTIALLGPSQIEKFGPKGNKVIYFHKKVECYPCRQEICKYPGIPCVNLNTVEEVKQGINLLLENQNQNLI